jgi:hypothetical protein
VPDLRKAGWQVDQLTAFSASLPMSGVVSPALHLHPNQAAENVFFRELGKRLLPFRLFEALAKGSLGVGDAPARQSGQVSPFELNLTWPSRINDMAGSSTGS